MYCTEETIGATGLIFQSPNESLVPLPSWHYRSRLSHCQNKRCVGGTILRYYYMYIGTCACNLASGKDTMC